MIAFLHTAHSHVRLFSDLLSEIAPTIPSRHEVQEGLLRAALAAGRVTDEVRQQTEQLVASLDDAGARVIVCTCSTLGSVVEAAPVQRGATLIRIDRALLEQALATGSPLLLVAATQGAMGAAVDLLRQLSLAPAEPLERSEPLEPKQVFCAAAWPHFMAGDEAAYAREIALTVEQQARPGDVVVLTQASMSKAAALIALPGVRVLTSPRLGVLAAVAAYRG